MGKKASYGIVNGPDRWQLAVALMHGKSRIGDADPSEGRQTVTFMITNGETVHELQQKRLLAGIGTNVAKANASLDKKIEEAKERGSWQSKMVIDGLGRDNPSSDDHWRFSGVIIEGMEEGKRVIGTYTISVRSGRIEVV